MSRHTPAPAPILRLLSLAMALAGSALAAEPPVVPETVCEVVADLASHEGKTVAVLGRYSFRRDGRWIGEQSCATEADDAAANTPAPVLRLAEDVFTGPKAPPDLAFDTIALNRKFAAMIRRTALGKFRFGTPDFDRWAVVVGRVVARKGEAAKLAPADLVFRGDGVVIFLTTEK
jgi:hypothetical protein